MVKVDLVRAVQEKTGLYQSEASQAVDEVIEMLKETLAQGEALKLSGFGTFLVRKRAERKGRNLTTGEAIPVKAKLVVKFEPSEQLKAMVNNESAVSNQLQLKTDR